MRKFVRFILFLTVALGHTVHCQNGSVDLQCYNAERNHLKGVSIIWWSYPNPALAKENRYLQCYILCYLSNLGVITPAGVVIHTKSPLAGSDKKLTPAKLIYCSNKSKKGRDACERASKSARCLVKVVGGPFYMNEYHGLGSRLKQLNLESRKAGKVIQWKRPEGR